MVAITAQQGIAMHVKCFHNLSPHMRLLCIDKIERKTFFLFRHNLEHIKSRL